MATLTIRLEGPMQYWSANVGLRERRTVTHPTKCAVIGLIANAMGRRYDDDISDLAGLRFAVTAVREGVVEHDYKTVGGAPLPGLPRDALRGGKSVTNPIRYGDKWTSGAPRNNIVPFETEKGTTDIPKSSVANPIIITDEYLADAAFEVTLAGDKTVLAAAHNAMQKPERMVYLGRRAYAASAPFVDQDSLQDQTFEEALAQWNSETFYETAPNAIDFTHMVNDQPVAYGPQQHRTLRGEAVKPAADNDFFDF